MVYRTDLEQPYAFCCKFVQRPAAQHKLLKVFDSLLDTFGEIADACNASSCTLQTITDSRIYAGVSGSVLSITHTFFRVIPGLVYSLRLLWNLGRGWVSQKEVPLNQFTSLQRLKYNEIAKGDLEIGLSLAATLFHLLSGISSTFSYCVYRPIVFAETFGKMQLGSAAYSLGQACSVFMVVKQAAACLGHAFVMGYQYVSSNRALYEGANFQDVQQNFVKEFLISALSLLERFLLLIFECSKWIQTPLPPWFRLPITLSAAGIGLYRTWLTT
ncbi:MAG: hypothetical protein S4CHLAM123_09150 [Chlamydiales bacterium]|nr:hypothetical protein [Chlamydiales bacterium]